MKILFIIGSLQSGGAERVCATLANYFAQHGETVYISTDTEREVAFEIDFKVTILNHREGCYDKFMRRKIASLRLLHTMSNFRKYERIYHPDVVISFLTTFNVYTIFALLGRSVPVIVCEHTTVTYKPPMREKIARDILYRFADAITVLTSKDYDLWKEHYPQLEIMPNPVVIRDISHEIQTREKRVIAAGRVTDWEIKGFDNLLICWGRICHKHPDWKLCIAGLTDDASLKYMKSVVEANACINVEFMGFRRDIFEQMQKSEVFVLTSRREGLPMALIEGMNAGCCCVAFDVVTGPSDIISDKENGFLVENQNIDKLTQALDDVMSNEVFRRRLAAKAPSAIEKFSTDNIARKWYALFNKVKRR